MNNFVERLKAEKSPHERRQLALQVAGGVTALLFVVWVSTLGVRLAQSGASAQQAASNTAATLVAVQAAASSTSTLLPGYSNQ
jgi:hypothetical protein